MFASDVNALGLQTAQGLTLTETWYWDGNDTNRAWTKRWQAERNAAGKFPTMIQAGVYSGITHYLKAVALRSKSAADGKAVVAEDEEDCRPTMRCSARARSAPMAARVHDAYLFEVKKPAESKYPGDFYKLKATIPAAEAFRPLKDGGCPLVSG